MKAMNNNSFTAQGNISIQSVNEASYLFGAYVCQQFERIGMRYSYRHVMQPLIENEGLTQLELVNFTNLKAPTISITLRNMERDGIVRREKDKSDLRETHVYITDKGKKMYTKVQNAVKKAEKTMLGGITETELKALRSTLDKMSSNLRTHIK